VTENIILIDYIKGELLVAKNNSNKKTADKKKTDSKNSKNNKGKKK
jgi:hypothetical protein